MGFMQEVAGGDASEELVIYQSQLLCDDLGSVEIDDGLATKALGTTGLGRNELSLEPIVGIGCGGSRGISFERRSHMCGEFFDMGELIEGIDEVSNQLRMSRIGEEMRVVLQPFLEEVDVGDVSPGVF